MTNNAIADLLRKLIGPSSKEQELESRCARLAETVENFKPKLKILAESTIEKNLYADLTYVFAKAETFDELFKQALDIFFIHLKANYSGIFWLNSREDAFECRHGRSYKTATMPAIPREGTLFGRCLNTKKVIFVPSLAEEKEAFDLYQNPREYNALYAPIIMMGKAAGVIALSNMDQEIALAAKEALQTIVPLMSSCLERLLYMEASERDRKNLDTMYAIARVLEETLDEPEIFKKVCAQVAGLFPCKMSFIVNFDNNLTATNTLAATPVDAWLGGSPSSHDIILRNLIAEYNDGIVLLPNIHANRIWSWSDMTVRSLCMVPIIRRGQLPCYLVVVGPANETYNKNTQSLLDLAATQAALTLERASHFRSQENLARRDGLTGLLNHRIFQETIRAEMENHNRYKKPLSLMIVDIDHFKKFNDTYGHPVGDKVIRRVAEILKKTPRSTDHAYRYGGEEFCLLLPETSQENAMILAQRLRTQIESDRTDNLAVTVSIGLTTAIQGEQVQAIIDRADNALYKAKESGRNRVVAL